MRRSISLVTALCVCLGRIEAPTGILSMWLHSTEDDDAQHTQHSWGHTASNDVYEAMEAGAAGARAMAAARRRRQREAIAAALGPSNSSAGMSISIRAATAAPAPPLPLQSAPRPRHHQSLPHHRRSQPSDSSSCAASGGSDDGEDNDAGPIPISISAAAAAAPMRRSEHPHGAAADAVAPAASSVRGAESSADDVVARRLRTAMRNTTASLRKELREHHQIAAQSSADARGASYTPRQSIPPIAAPDELPPPLPLLSGLRSNGANAFAHRSPPRIGFGDAAYPLLATPMHRYVIPCASEPLVAMDPAERQDLIARLKQYDTARADPEVALSDLFVNRLVYDATAAPVFARRWIVPRSRRDEKCTCSNCVLLQEPGKQKASKASLHPDSGGESLLGRSSLRPSESDLTCVRGGAYSAELRSFYTPSSPSDTTLVFESRFESGNLRTAFQVSSTEYDLSIRPDFNTSHHTQWFYFSLRNTRKSQAYKFNIINCTKPASLFNEGMQPVMYSTIASQMGAAMAAANGSQTETPMHPFAIPMAAASFCSASPPSAGAGAASAPAGWFRTGSHVVYYPNHLSRGSSRLSHYSTLSFTLQFPHDDDLVFLAFAVPYTYTDLNRDLGALEADASRARFMRRRILCRTLAGNEVDVITITDFGGTDLNGGSISPRAAVAPQTGSGSAVHASHAAQAALAAQAAAAAEESIRSRPGIFFGARVHPGESNSAQQAALAAQVAAAEEAIRARPGIFFSARVHPGETNSSWIMRGLLAFLTGSSPEAHKLRQTFVFKICPMINVDGVVVGNYRCSLAGVDLNRQWRLPSPITHPEISALKALLTRMQRRPGGVKLAVDIHGHSRKMCVFMYGCPALPPAAVPVAVASGSNGATGEDTAGAGNVAAALAPAPAVSSSKKRSKASSSAAVVELNPNRFLERLFPRLLARETLASAAATQARAQAEAAQAQADATGSSADIAAAATLASASATAAASAARLASRATGFSFPHCSFTISRGKESTARAVLYRELGVANSYTLEASFAGCDRGALKGLQFNIEHLQNMGRNLGETLLEFADPIVFEATRTVLQTAGVASTAAADKGQEDDSDDSSDSPDEYAPPTSMLPVVRSSAGGGHSPRKKRTKKISKKAASQRRMDEKLARLQSGAPTTPAATTLDSGSRSRATAAMAAASLHLPLKDVNGVAPSALNSTSSFSSTSREAADRLRSMWRSTTGLSTAAEAEAAASAAAATAASMAAIAEEHERRRLLKQRKMAAAHQKRRAILMAAAEVDDPIRRREGSPSSPSSASYAPSASAFAAGIGASGYFRMPQSHAAAAAARPTAALMALSLSVEDRSASPHAAAAAGPPLHFAASGDESSPSPSPPHHASAASPVLQASHRSGDWIDAALSSWPPLASTSAALSAASHHPPQHRGHVRGASFGASIAAAAAAASRARPKSAYGAPLRSQAVPADPLPLEAERERTTSTVRPSSATLLSKARRASSNHSSHPPPAASPSPPPQVTHPAFSALSGSFPSGPVVQWDELLKSSREGSAESLEHRRAHQARAEQLDRIRRENERAERAAASYTHKRASSSSFGEDSFASAATQQTSAAHTSLGASAFAASHLGPSRLSLRHAASATSAPARSPMSSGGNGLGGWAGGLRGSSSASTNHSTVPPTTANGLAPSGIVGQSLRASSNHPNAGSALSLSVAVSAAPRSTSTMANRR